MRENELAELLIRMAADAGVDLEPAADELATIALPSFVDARQFRGAVVQRVEAHLRAQMEVRLESIRRRFDVEVQPLRSGSSSRMPETPRSAPPPVAAPVAEPMRSPIAMDGMPDLADATMTDLASPGNQPSHEDTVVAGEDELPSDATMVWTTRHG
jgi:hypothetical protein